MVGGAVGAVTGEDKNVNACLDCGTSWKAVDLYKILQVVKNSTGETLDLAAPQDRDYMNSSYIEAISTAEKKAIKLITETQNKSVENAGGGCGYGCAASIMGFFLFAKILSSGGALMMIILPPLIGMSIGLLIDKINKKSVDREVVRAKREASQMKLEAEENLKFATKEFMYKYHL
ncbi:hypothetical protein [Chamaesiphon sp.]|uniref:hypothetical protein n=1 Tax=Chamaesiphon sp. TaxID=2814140 RepID=UPI0035947BE6